MTKGEKGWGREEEGAGEEKENEAETAEVEDSRRQKDINESSM